MPCSLKAGALALLALTLLHLAVAAVTPLVPDETYYWVWSRALAAGYLDHPPMVALWIRAGTFLCGPTALGVRLLGPLSAALGSVLLYDAAERLFPGRRAGPTAAALLNATLLLGVGAVIMTPDTPLLFFWTAALWAGARLAAGGSPRWWLVVGLCAGLALASKYTGVFLPLGLGLFLLFARSHGPGPRDLWRPEPWLGLLLAGLVFLPVILWNADHGWAGFARQGGRVADWRPERAATFLAELLFGQIGLATPGVFVLFVVGLAAAARAAMRTRALGMPALEMQHRAGMLLTALSLPAALVFLQHAIGDRVQGNWPAILYPAAAVAAASLVTAPLAAHRWRRLVWPSAALGLGLTALAYGHAATGWPTGLAARDPAARQLSGWDGLAARVEAARIAAGADFIAAEPYGFASELAWTLPPGTRVLGMGAHWDLTALPREGMGGGKGLLVRLARYGDAPDPAVWRDISALDADPGTKKPDREIARVSGKTEIERYRLFLVRAVSAGTAPGVWLPRP